MSRQPRLVQLAVIGLVSLALGMCISARGAFAQQPITQVYLASQRSTWDTTTARVCMKGSVRDGAALVTGYSIALDCQYRIGFAERMGNRQCEEERGCLRLWRMTFDAGGATYVWIREWTPSGFLRASAAVLDTRRWRLAFDPLGWA